MNICFIGYGNMAKAIASSLATNQQLHIFAASPSLPEGISPEGIHTHYNNTAMIPKADVIIIAVKPTQVAHVIKEIRAFIPSSSVLVSIAAGVNLSQLNHLCPNNQAIIRCMPNTPIAVNQGASAFIANAHTSANQIELINSLFQCAGITVWVSDEQQINAITALSGSGPAYVFLFLESLIKAAEILGINHDTATSFATQTLRGALSLLEKSGESPQDLRKKVTSPAGTTAAAIAILQAQKFEHLVYLAMQAAYDRAKELNDGNNE